MVQRFLSAQADAFTGSERGTRDRSVPLGMTVVGSLGRRIDMEEIWPRIGIALPLSKGLRKFRERR
jgi:hypothetical protein